MASKDIRREFARALVREVEGSRRAGGASREAAPAGGAKGFGGTPRGASASTAAGFGFLTPSTELHEGEEEIVRGVPGVNLEVSRRSARRWLGPAPARLVMTGAGRAGEGGAGQGTRGGKESSFAPLSLRMPFLFVAEFGVPMWQRAEILRLADDLDAIGMQPAWQLPEATRITRHDTLGEPRVVCDSRGEEQCALAVALAGSRGDPVGFAAPCGLTLMENRLLLPLVASIFGMDERGSVGPGMGVGVWTKTAFSDTCMSSPGVRALVDAIRHLSGWEEGEIAAQPEPFPRRALVLFEFETRTPFGGAAMVKDYMLGSIKNAVPFIASVLPEMALRGEEASPSQVHAPLHWATEFLLMYWVTSVFNWWTRYRPYRDTASGEIVSPSFVRVLGEATEARVGVMLSHGAMRLAVLASGTMNAPDHGTGAVGEECAQFDAPAKYFNQRDRLKQMKRLTPAAERQLLSPFEGSLPPHIYVEYMTHVWQRVVQAAALWINTTRVVMRERLYRGVRTVPGHFDAPEPGQVFEEEGFLSLTNELRVALDYAEPGGDFEDGDVALLEFPDTRLRCLVKAMENEFALPPGTRWRVVREEPRFEGRRHFICELLDPHAWATTRPGPHHFFVPDSLREALPTLRAKFPLLEAFVEKMQREADVVTPAHRLVHAWAADSGHYMFRREKPAPGGSPRPLFDTWRAGAEEPEDEGTPSEAGREPRRGDAAERQPGSPGGANQFEGTPSEAGREAAGPRSGQEFEGTPSEAGREAKELAAGADADADAAAAAAGGAAGAGGAGGAAGAAAGSAGGAGGAGGISTGRIEFVKRSLVAGRFLNVAEREGTPSAEGAKEFEGTPSGAGREAAGPRSGQEFEPGQGGGSLLARIRGERLVEERKSGESEVYPEVLFWPSLASSVRLQVLPAARYSECVMSIRQRLLGELQGEGTTTTSARLRQTYLPSGSGTMRRFTAPKPVAPTRTSKRQHLQLRLDERVGGFGGVGED